MKLSRSVSYAVNATIRLAQHASDDPVSCRRLASEGNMPERFLLQILRNLVTHGILRSTRGVDGGYALNRPPDEISLLDLMEAVEGPLETSDPAEDQLPEDTQTHLKSALEQITSTSRQQLEAINVQHLLQPPNK